jgi:HlyD family secretion protein
MLQRRRKSKVKKWALWTIGSLAIIVLTLGLIRIDDVVMARGTTEPGQKIYIDSPLSRVVKRIVAEAGDTVTTGNVVALLYDGDLRAEVASTEKHLQGAEATLRVTKAQLARLEEQPTEEELRISESTLEQAQINLRARKQSLDRAKHLYLGERLWSQEDLDQAQTNYDLAEANIKVAAENLNMVRRGPLPSELRQAQAEVQEAVANLGRSTQDLEAAHEALDLATLRSPVDGVVARQDLYPGMLASQGQIVMIIAGSSRRPILSAQMGETDAWKVRPGQTVEILSNLFTDPEEFMALGEVSEVYGYAIAEGGARTFSLEVDIEQSPIPLRYGSTADLRIIVGRRSILQTIFGMETDSAIEAGKGHEIPVRSRQAAPPTIAKPQESPDAKPTDTPTSSRTPTQADRSA